MKRLTVNRKQIIYDNDKRVNDICVKCSDLEDIEQEIGVDLITLFKALKNGFYIIDAKMYFSDLEIGYPNLLYSKLCNTWYIGQENEDIEFWYDLKDYGKTWSLTQRGN